MRRPSPAVALPLLVAITAALLHSLVLLAHPAGEPLLKYPVAAEQHLRGELSAERAADFSPLYLGLHVAVRKLVPDPLPVFVVLQIAATSLSALVLFLAVQGCAGTALALAGAAAFIFNPSVIVYTRVLEPESLLLLLLLGFAFCAVQEGAASRLASGFFLALCLLTRPSFLPLALLVPLWLRVREGPGPRWRRQAALFLLPLALLFIFIGSRAVRESGRPLLFMNPGQVFFEGNNPLANGLGLAYPPLVDDIAREFPGQVDYQHAVYRLLAERVAGRDLTVAEVNRYWSGKALAFIRDEPALFARRLAAKALFFLHDYRRHDVMMAQQLDRELSESRLPSVPFALVSALALGGLALLAPSWKRYFPYYLVLAGQFGLAVLVYVTDRQRVSVVPFFIFFAAAAVARARPGRKRLALLLVLAAPLAAALSIRGDAMKEDEHLWTVYAASGRLQGEAGALREQGDLAGAARSVAAALAQTPWMSDWIRPSGLSFGPAGLAGSALAQAGPAVPADFSGRLDRAILLIEAGRHAEAERLLLEVVAGGHRFARVFDGSSRPEFYLAVIAAARGDRLGAVGWLKGALAESPGDPFSLAWLAAITGEEEHRGRLHSYFDDADAAFQLGQAHLELGDAKAAADAFAEVVRLAPEYRRGRIYLAAALGAAGHYEQAAETYLDAVRERPEPVLLEAEMLRIFAALAARHPGNADAVVWGRFVRCQFEACPP